MLLAVCTLQWMNGFMCGGCLGYGVWIIQCRQASHDTAATTTLIRASTQPNGRVRSTQSGGGAAALLQQPLVFADAIGDATTSSSNNRFVTHPRVCHKPAAACRIILPSHINAGQPFTRDHACLVASALRFFNQPMLAS
jgi:hypothetical protein